MLAPGSMNFPVEEVQLERPARKARHTQQEVHIRQDRGYAERWPLEMAIALALRGDADAFLGGNVQGEMRVV